MADSKVAEELDKQLAELKEWVTKQPHVPKDMDDKLLRRFLHSCYYDLGNAQKAIEAFTSIRLTAPDLFVDRDPLSPRIQNISKFVKVALLRVSGNRNLWIFQINDPGLVNFDHREFVRNFLISIDAWFLEEKDLEESAVTIFDARHITWKIFWKINMSVVKNMAKYQEEALPIRIKQMHMVNAPPFMNKLFSIMKQFMSQEMVDLVHFHVPKSETLFQFFSKDELPKDLGGNLGCLEDYNEKITELLHKHRDKLMKDELWRAPEKKSKNTSKSGPTASQTSNEDFRSMAID